jgi:two-component system phosphate regulon response regulator PhoB
MATAARASIADHRPDLLLVDWMLPGLSGLEICKQMGSKVPLLMVTARADTSDIVLGLEMGADDYITKPFEIPVLLARVRTLLRRSSLATSELDAKNLKLGNLELDAEAHRVKLAGKDLQLTHSEFKLLLALLRNHGRVLSRDRLIELVQGEGIAVIDRAIDTHVFGLRRKLGEASDLVETIRGVGYRIKSP